MAAGDIGQDELIPYFHLFNAVPGLFVDIKPVFVFSNPLKTHKGVVVSDITPVREAETWRLWQIYIRFKPQIAVGIKIDIAILNAKIGYYSQNKRLRRIVDYKTVQAAVCAVFHGHQLDSPFEQQGSAVSFDR